MSEERMKKIRGKEVKVSWEHHDREITEKEYDKHREHFEEMDRRELEENVFKLVNALGDLVNVMGSEHQKAFTEAFANALRRTHNTLEQSLVTNILNALFIRFSPLREHSWVDLRNQDSSDTVNKIRELLKADEYRMYYKGSYDDEELLHASLI